MNLKKIFKLSRGKEKAKSFEEWHKSNPGKSFKAYYAEQVLEQLSQGRSHATLGPNLKKGEEFGKSGLKFFNIMMNQGVKQDHVLVDYGCGTLRIGVHFIKFLKPKNYWGLDIDKKLLKYGRELLGNKLYSQKKPNLHVIAPEGVNGAAASKPDFVISVAVVIHVHPDELEEYFRNLSTIMHRKSKAVLTARFAEETVMYSGRSWAHGEKLFYSLASKYGLSISVVESENWHHADPEINGKRDTLLLSKIK